jgi:3'-phosphoadenosine 5'-phosphosulfate sulfotransferase (PAPS reductase)/FAD synthetase
MSAFTKDDLKRFQAESLDEKFQRSLAKIAEWFSRWNNEVYVSFSGGKDSTVLADICARWCKIIGKPLYLVFVNTGLEYPEIQKFVKEYAEYLRNKYGIEVVLEILRPKMRFDEVIKKYGYPIIGKRQANTVALARKNLEDGIYSVRLMNLGVSIEEAKTNGLQMPADEMLERYKKSSSGSMFNVHKYRELLTADFKISDVCCDVMKKSPAHEYQKRTGRKPILATMTEESMLREKSWLQNGCNAFDAKRPRSAPMSFWTEQDVYQYIKEEQLPIASVYGDIVYAEDPEQMRIEDFGIDCGGGEKLCTTGCDRTGCIFCAFGCHLEKEPSRFQRLKQTHPRQYEYCIGGGEYDENGVWKPNKQGLGMGHVFDELNKIYGEGFIKY